MQIAYKFRVAFEDHDYVVRFIDILSTSTFADFHKIIQESIGFDGLKEYSFSMSNDIWRNISLICSTEKSQENANDPKKTTLNRYINDPHQRFLYYFDPELEWSFYIELVKIFKAETNKSYPFLARKENEAPKQNRLKGKQPGVTATNDFEKMAEMMMVNKLMEELGKPSTANGDSEDDEKPKKAKTKTAAVLPVKKVEVEAEELDFDEEELSVEDDDLSLLDAEEGEESDADFEDDDHGDSMDDITDDDSDDY